jgi:TetR/AcrR family transcriptional regulator, repressor of fatR-cypB operon
MNIHSPMARTAASSTRDKRQAILDAALGLFVERGYHGTAVPEVAARAGVGAGTIYRYFASKEALVNELYQEHKQALATRLLDGFPAGAPAREQFHALWTRMAAFAREFPKAWAFVQLHHHADYLDADSRAVEARIDKTAEALLETTQKRGEIKRLPSALLFGLVLGSFTGVVRAAWEGRIPLTDETIQAAEQCCWEAIRA